MRGPNAKALSSLLSSAMKINPKPNSKPKTLAAIVEQNQASSTLTLDDSTLKLFVSSLETNPASNRSDGNTKKTAKKKKSSDLVSLSELALSAVKSKALSDSVAEELPSDVDTKRNELSKTISLLIAGALDKHHSGAKPVKRRRELDIPWMPSLSHNVVSLRRKDVVRDRKLKWVFLSNQSGRFDRLVDMCADKVGSDTTFDLFGKLGRETGVNEYNAFIKVCIETARLGNTEEIILNQNHKVFLFFKSMKEHGFQLEEETYGPFLAYLTEMSMVEEFFFFCEIIEDVNPGSSSKLGYYEMLLWNKVGAEDKIQELCRSMEAEECEQSLAENYLMALCEVGRDKEFLQLSKNIDITKFTSTDSLAAIFKLLGKLQSEAVAKDFILAFKARDFQSEDLSDFLCCYAIGNTDIAVEDVILNFTNLLNELELKSSFASYEKLIKYCCEINEVGTALDLFGKIFEGGLTVSVETINYILRTCEETYNYNMVHRVYSLIHDNNLAVSVETFKLMISLCVKMNDMEAAHKMLRDMEKMNLGPTSHIYNIIVSGCLRENNMTGVVKVLNQMGNAAINPDSATFAQLINKCVSEKDIDKYWELLKNSGVLATKRVFMALIQAYANCGLFEKAKQVVNDKSIPVKHIFEVKSVLVQALATNGQMSEALKIYEEIKKASCKLDYKAVISIIEHYESDGDSSTLPKWLDELVDPVHWLDGCTRAITFCIRQKDLSTTTDLLKKLKDKVYVDDELVLEAALGEVFSVIGDLEKSHLHFGLKLLSVVKDDLGITLPRKCLDFVLHACVAAKDLKNARLIWKEYDAAGLPHNIISYLRMYQVLLASRDHKTADVVLTKIPKDDPHVRYIMKVCQTVYSNQVKRKKK